ncbi:amino acid adenylation domain-containing protein [Algoriphagus sp. SE2]|uniref:amino acid adenylation domain-containing protein n=1 Tax=Algoriphagus sp. SE2 TaxID=3141536 RepID=UPI0031CD3C86
MSKDFSYNSIIDLVKESWSKYSDKVAIDTGVEQITFQKLEENVTSLSRLILSEAADEEIIALTTTRGAQLIINILAILNAGKTYLPIDPSFPENRIKQIVEDCGVKFYLKSNPNDFLNLESIDLDGTSDIDEFEIKYNDLAYILYTSGSTGKPKGVCVPHEGIINLIQWQVRNSFSKPGVKTLQFTRLTFDISVQEIFSTLCSGGTLQIVDAEILRDNSALINVLNEQKVQRLFLPFVALQGIANEAENSSVYPEYLEEVMTCGEQLKSTKAVKALFSKINKAKLFNQYGPTECTCIVTQLELPSDPSKWDDLPTIGKAIDGVESLILDKNLNVITEAGVEGEIYFSGVCMARGYLNQPELTKKSFFPLTLKDGTSQMVYKTGDLGYYTENQEIFFLGRIDDQVKISGFRVETGEIESVATELPGVEQAAIIVNEYEDGQKYLSLFYVSAANQVRESEMLSYLKERLPIYMIPANCIRKDSFPKTSNGKIDRKGLSQNLITENPFKENYVKPRGKVESDLANIWKRILNLDQVGRDDHFFELGGSSFLAQRMAIEIKKTFGKEFTVTKIYQYPKLKAQAAYLQEKDRTLKHSAHKKKDNSENNRDVAVIATASRFPGANNSYEFWEMIKNGKETIHFFEIDELDPSEQKKAKEEKNYIKARGIIKDIKDFDNEFFGFNPKLASAMDPQQRLFLEVAFEALDSVGYIANTPDFEIGVFAGCSTNYYFSRNLVFDRDLRESLGNLQINSVNEKDYLATRVAYIFDLKGPAVSVNTACSTALVAVANAVKSIRSGECTAAIAGASSVAYPVNSGHIYEEGSILTKDGHCRPFDADASGTLFSDGGGAVLLKDYEQAMLDGDPILAVIKGVGINNDGANKSSFSAPSVEGQAGSIMMALQDAEVNPSEIGYVETHGTATPIGDPIEIEGLKLAFGDNVRNQSCAIGSVKGNVGHLNAAAGIVGLIKTIHSLHEKTLPKSIGFEKPNPSIDFENSPFFVQNETKEWASEGPRKAGVSSFGIGGTNCHIILEEFVSTLPKKIPTTEIEQTIYFSANTENSLKKYAERLSDFVVQNPLISLGQFGYNVNKNNAAYKLSSFVTFKNQQELLAGLEEVISGKKSITRRKGTFNFPVFLFPGQGAQYVSMGKELYEKEPIFRNELDLCDSLFAKYTRTSLFELLFPNQISISAEENLANTRNTQPVIFAISYSLAKLWESKGIKPSAFIGHSIGEFVAACLSGVMGLEDAVKIVAKRGKLISDLSPGSMLSIRSSAEVILPILPQGITIAADNAPNLCVASGPTNLIESFEIDLKQKGIASKILQTSHAFHSEMMDPALDEFKKLLNSIELRNPKIPIMSTVTGNWMKDSEATSSDYWTQHMRLPVQFNNAIKNLLNELPEAAMVEVGPGKSLGTFLMQHEAAKNVAFVNSLNKTSNISEFEYFQEQVCALVGQGLILNWDEIYDEAFQEKILLPTYAFDKKRCWIDVKIENVKDSKELPNYSEDQVIKEVEELGNTNSAKEIFESKLSQILKDACGVTVSVENFGMTYFEIGLDSLSMTQLAFSIKKEFKVDVSFLQLNNEFNTPGSLVEYCLANSDLAKKIISAANKNKTAQPVLHKDDDETSDVEETIVPELSEKAKIFINNLSETIQNKTLKNKKLPEESSSINLETEKGFGLKSFVSKLNYPIITKTSKGSQLIDLEGNKYLDWSSGLASNLFGYQPDFINKAIIEQVQSGLENAVQGNLIETVSKNIAQITQSDTVAIFENSSDAKYVGIDAAREVSKKNLVIMFSHRDFEASDKELSSRKLMKSDLNQNEIQEDILILEYGTSESLEIIESRSSDIAAVLVEPIQLNRLEFIPLDFLKELREISSKHRICLIFDEINTGFRSHINGFQGLYSIKSDMAIYGDILGGGFSIGILTGSEEWLGNKRSTNLNSPNNPKEGNGISYFTNSFSGHPLSLITTNAILEKLEKMGGDFQKRLIELCQKLVKGLNAIFEKYNAPYMAEGFSSIWRIQSKEDFQTSEIVFILLRENGINILENLPCYVSDAHTESDVLFTLAKVDEIIKVLVENEVIYGDLLLASENWMSIDNPPFEGAKISLNEEGFPIWVTSEQYKESKSIILQSFFL